MQQQGSLQKWVGEKGFGFLRPDDGNPDVFVHSTELAKAGVLREPRLGERFIFEIAPDRRDPMKVRAVNLKLV